MPVTCGQEGRAQGWAEKDWRHDIQGSRSWVGREPALGPGHRVGSGAGAESWEVGEQNQADPRPEAGEDFTEKGMLQLGVEE